MLNIECQATFRIVLCTKCFRCCYRVEYVNTKRDTSNHGGSLNRVSVIQQIREQHTGKVRNQGLLVTAVLGTARM